MTVVYAIMAVIGLALWTWFVLLFGKHNQNKVNALQSATDSAAAKVKAATDAELTKVKAELAALKAKV